MAQRVSTMDYIAEAFKWHWNLLAVGAGVVFSVLSGKPDMFIPILGAAEITYLGLLSTNPKFRRAIDARQQKDESTSLRKEQLRKIMNTLPTHDKERFEELKERCSTLNRLGKQFRGPESTEEFTFDNMHIASLDRLLWMFLKLLYSKDAIDRFLNSTDRNELLRDVRDTQGRIDELEADESKRSIVRSLTDKIDTLNARLENYDNAEGNCELIEAELDRIEQKITAICEQGLNSRDPSSLTTQVDGIAESISATTKAMQDLEVVPDLEFDDAPEFICEE
ncbi:MAG: hypothetical protein JXR97_05760 [Planctomycetes bacterium]|nr:hypothetical protein [Planctomycetota bacterium]